jgi:DNA-binding MarR family transcriptional regulator
MAAIFTLVQVYTKINDALAEQARPFGLTLAHLEVLLCLRSGEGISQQELAERLLVTKGNICVIVQKMEASGLLERRVDSTDQRLHRLYLTDAARHLLARVMPGHRELLARIVGNLTAAEQKTLHEFLARMEETIENLNA